MKHKNFCLEKKEEIVLSQCYQLCQSWKKGNVLAQFSKNEPKINNFKNQVGRVGNNVFRGAIYVLQSKEL